MKYLLRQKLGGKCFMVREYRTCCGFRKDDDNDRTTA